MTPESRRLVQDSWRVLGRRGDEFAQYFYARLLAIDPSASRLFVGVDMAAQRAKLADMLNTVVEGLDAPEAIVPVVAELGRRHVAYGARPAHYASVGAALLDALAFGLGAAFTPAMREAWTAAYALIADVMQRGAAAPDTPSR